MPSSGDLSPTRSGIRSFQEGESPKADEANDFKRYDRLAKICNQMKERETELNSKTQNLEELNRRNMDLQRQLAEMTELASKAQNSNESSNTIQGIRNTLSEKNYLIESIEKYKEVYLANWLSLLRIRSPEWEATRPSSLVLSRRLQRWSLRSPKPPKNQLSQRTSYWSFKLKYLGTLREEYRHMSKPFYKELMRAFRRFEPSIIPLVLRMVNWLRLSNKK